MRASRFTRTAVAFALTSLFPAWLYAQTVAQNPAAAQALRAEIDQLRKDFDARLASLESRLAAIARVDVMGAEVRRVR